MTTTLELTILMPCLNEAETIAACVAEAKGFFARTGVSGEVLVADNGSTDGSQALAEAAGARVETITERGYGAALMGGIAAARGRYIAMGDADMSYDFSTLDPFLEKLRAGAGLVMGNRFAGGIEPGAMPPLHRYLGNPVLSWIGRLFFKTPVRDFHCGLRAFSRDAVLGLDLRSTGMEFASEMVVKAQLKGLRIEEAPTKLRPDGRSRPPHLKTWRDGWRHLRFLLLHSPRWLFVYPGLVALLGGAAVAAAIFPGALTVAPGLVLDIHTFAAACFSMIVGAQLMLFGAIARRRAAAEGFLPHQYALQRMLSGLDLERMLQLALALLLIGLAGAGWSFFYWAGRGLGPIEYPLVLRVLLLSLTAITVAIQAGSAAFLSSLFEIRR